MERLEFLVEGSRGDEYTVAFEVIGSKAKAFCTCQAGSNGLYCKHRLSIMDGVLDQLISGNMGDVGRLKSLLQGTDLAAAYDQVVQTEKMYEAAKKDFEAAKKTLNRAMYRVRRFPRTQSFGITFKDGLAKGWAFSVPEAFKDQLDILYTEFVDKERSKELRKKLSRNEDGTLPTIHRMAWSRGAPPLRGFDVGHIFYDPPEAWGMIWADALLVLQRSVQVTEARPDDVPGAGWVKVRLQHYEDGAIIRTGTHNLSQTELENFLRTGHLPAGHEDETTLVAEVVA